MRMRAPAGAPILAPLVFLLGLLIWPPCQAAADPTADLLKAATQGNLPQVQQLLGQGVPVNAVDPSGWTALMKASFEGHTAVVQELLKRGADVNVRGDAGWTALMQAAQFGHLEIVRLLVERGARLDEQSVNGSTGIMFAATNGTSKWCASCWTARPR
jgi:ankyrin repeat protein